MSELSNSLHLVEEMIKGTAKGIFHKIDEVTFKMTINGLKSEDYEAIAITIDQLAREKRLISIPPLYVVSQKHPNLRAREKAKAAIQQIDQRHEVDKLVAGKDVKEATQILIDTYGHYKQP